MLWSGTFVPYDRVGSRTRIYIDQPRGNATVRIACGKYFPARHRVRIPRKEREPVAKLLQHLWSDERGQDIAEYAVMLAVILVIVVGTIRLIGGNANNVFSQVGSSIASP